MSAAAVELGRHLFYDKRLCGNGTQSCSTCHVQELAFTEAGTELHPASYRHLRITADLLNQAFTRPAG